MVKPKNISTISYALCYLSQTSLNIKYKLERSKYESPKAKFSNSLSNTFSLGHHGPRTHIVTDDQRELAKQNNHVISTPFKMMYVMADLSLDDR